MAAVSVNSVKTLQYLVFVMLLCYAIDIIAVVVAVAIAASAAVVMTMMTTIMTTTKKRRTKVTLSHQRS